MPPNTTTTKAPKAMISLNSALEKILKFFLIIISKSKKAMIPSTTASIIIAGTPMLILSPSKSDAATIDKINPPKLPSPHLKTGLSFGIAIKLPAFSKSLCL